MRNGACFVLYGPVSILSESQSVFVQVDGWLRQRETFDERPN